MIQAAKKLQEQSHWATLSVIHRRVCLTCNSNVLIGEDKHRLFKKIIYQSNFHTPSFFLSENNFSRQFAWFWPTRLGSQMVEYSECLKSWVSIPSGKDRPLLGVFRSAEEVDKAFIHRQVFSYTPGIYLSTGWCRFWSTVMETRKLYCSRLLRSYIAMTSLPSIPSISRPELPFTSILPEEVSPCNVLVISLYLLIAFPALFLLRSLKHVTPSPRSALQHMHKIIPVPVLLLRDLYMLDYPFAFLCTIGA